MSKLDDLAAWKVFLSLSRTRNLSTTAAEFDVEVSTISRAIGSLEKALGQGLIERNTRPLKLTEAGKHAAEMMNPILDMHSEVVQELLSKNTSLSGKIRISHAQGFVEKFMMPMILEFNSMYPDISFEVVGNGSLTDVLDYRADLAVISFPTEQKRADHRLVTLSRGRNVYVPIASPKYIEQFGKPIHPRDLKNHTVFLYDGSVRGSTKELLNDDGQVEPVVWNRVLRIGNILGIKKAVMDGLGVSIDMPLLHCYKEIAEGTLIPLLPGWAHTPVECYVVLLKSNWNIRRHRIFAEWYSKKLKEFFDGTERIVRPYWTPPTRTKLSQS